MSLADDLKACRTFADAVEGQLACGDIKAADRLFASAERGYRNIRAFLLHAENNGQQDEIEADLKELQEKLDSVRDRFTGVGEDCLAAAMREHAFTAGLTDLQIAKLAAVAHEVWFHDNDVVLVTGEQSKSFYLLLSGSMCIEVRTPSYVVWVQILGPGEAFGWSALLDHHDTLFQVRAREVSRALCLDGERLSAILRGDSELAAELLRRTLKLVAGRVQATEARLGELCGVKVK